MAHTQGMTLFIKTPHSSTASISAILSPIPNQHLVDSLRPDNADLTANDWRYYIVGVNFDWPILLPGRGGINHTSYFAPFMGWYFQWKRRFQGNTTTTGTHAQQCYGLVDAVAHPENKFFLLTNLGGSEL